MEHTQGKLEAKQLGRRVGIQLGGKNHFLSNDYVNDFANARRICQCVNSHDALLKACEWARDLYDQLALSPLEAAAKYGPGYIPPTDKDWLNMRTKLEQAIEQAKGQ